MKKKLFMFLLVICLITSCAFIFTACNDEEDEPPIEKQLTSISVTITNGDLLSKYDGENNTLTYTNTEYVSITNADFNVTANYDDGSTETVTDFSLILDNELNNGYASVSETPYTVLFDYNGKTFTMYVKVNATEVEKPTYLTDQTFTYDMNEQMVFPDYYDPNVMTIEGNARRDAGTYDVTISLLDGYVWSDGTTAPVTFPWTINKDVMNKPTGVIDSTFCGEKMSPVIYGFDYFRMEVTTEGQRDAGTYDVTIAITDTNYMWEDGTSDPITLPWTINKYKVDKVTVDTTSFEYHPYGNSIYFNGYLDENFITVSGDVEGLNTGDYSVTLTLKDKTNTAWSDDTTEDLVFPWKITKRLVLYTPAVHTDYFGYTYSGEEQSVMFENYYEGAPYTASGDLTATDAGNYTVTFTLNDPDNYRWQDGTSEPISYDWVMKKKPLGKPYKFESYDYTYNASVIELNVSEELGDVISVTGNSATNAGTYTATFTLNDPDNYVWDDGDESVTHDVEWKIEKASVSKPHLYNKSYFYTGSEIKADLICPGYSEINLSDVFNITGDLVATDVKTKEVVKNEGTDDEYTDIEIDTYAITIALKDTANYKWSGYEDVFESESLSFTWRIVPKEVSVPTLKETSKFTYTGLAYSLTSKHFDGWLDCMTLAGDNENKTDAGWYDVSISLPTDSYNYAWNGGWTLSTRTRYTTWSITKAELTVPTLSEKSTNLIYNTTEQTIVLDNFDSNTMTIERNTGTVARTYYAHVTLKDDNNYKWVGTTSTQITIEWSIGKCYVDRPTLDGVNLTLPYKQNEQLIFPNGYNEDIMMIYGNNGKELGNYTATVKLYDTSNYAWNGIADDFVFDWTIVPAVIPESSEPVFNYPYRMEMMVGAEWVLDESYMQYVTCSSIYSIKFVSSETAYKPGTYTFRVEAMNTNYVWANGTSFYDIEWVVNKSEILSNLTINKTFTADGTEQTLTASDITGFDGDIMELLVDNTTQTDAGTYKVSIKLKNPDFHYWENYDEDIDTITLDWVISPASQA